MSDAASRLVDIKGTLEKVRHYLSEEEWRLLLLRCESGHTFVELGALLGEHAHTLEVRLRRACARVRDLLAKEDT